MIIEVQNVDISSLAVDLVVNAANSTLLGGGGVDGVIHKKAGIELAKACWQLQGCKTGDVKVTDGFNLNALYVAHAVGPRYSGGGKDEAALLKSCYDKTIEFALANNIQSIAFPAISCGIYRYPINEAAEIAVGAIYPLTKTNRSIKKIIFACSDDTYDDYVGALAALMGN